MGLHHLVSEFNDNLAILYKADRALTGPDPFPGYSLEQIGSKHGQHHLPAPRLIYPFLMIAAGTFYSVDSTAYFPSKAYVIINNDYSKNKPFRKYKDEDVCFLFLHDFIHCPKEINVNYLSQTFLDDSFY